MSPTSTYDRHRPLAGFNVISLAQNLPGPVALAMLVADGVSATKIETPSGDLLRLACPAWYEDLHRGIEVYALDLREPSQMASLRTMLAQSDLLITSQRPSALSRLGITATSLREISSRLCWVEIVGDARAPEAPGHDLTYQMDAGLVCPPSMPLTLIADLGGAADAARAGLALLLGRERGSQRRHRTVGLKQAALAFAAPVGYGLTRNGGALSGAFPGYGIHPLKNGWAAVAAIEPKFSTRLMEITSGDPEGFLSDLSVSEVNEIAKTNDLPISTVFGSGRAP
ncbi:CoA transferase [Brevundimonas sp.]|jgi:alpha-methylacyl-CoA racemase|uniref:CoA transferase n=1 Tax=unclassified Brevundimonas TaxID=2622653 RepID=UPI0019C31389|nr:CoA transferase [Brevundimonas sp.]MBD3836124.1 CoA transferase [Brevundimonas sp.]